MPTTVQSATALYLHVPFCASSCDFCSFYQEQPKRGEIDRYLSAIEREMELHPPGRPAALVIAWPRRRRSSAGRRPGVPPPQKAVSTRPGG